MMHHPIVYPCHPAFVPKQWKVGQGPGNDARSYRHVASYEGI